MKKVLCYCLSLAMLSSSASATSVQKEDIITISSINITEFEDVRYITDEELDESTDYEEYSNYIHEGGIIVVKHETLDPVMIGNELGMALEFETFNTEDLETQVSKSGHTIPLSITVATLYYEYGNGKKGSYRVNVSANNLDKVDYVIDNVINEIHKRQNNYEEATTVMSVDDESVYATHLNTLDTVNYCSPKGTLNASYKLYSLEDYMGEDFYIIKARYDGTPGCVLADSSNESVAEDFDSQYQGEWLYTSIETPTTSVAVDDYGPESTVNSTSYSVDISGSIDTSKVLGFSTGFNWSRSISDVDITANRYSDCAEWDLDLSWAAHTRTITFEPGVTFDCPTGKTYLYFDVYAAYTTDSLLSLEEDIVIDERIRCTISSAVFY